MRQISLNGYPGIRSFLKTNTISDTCPLYNWLINRASYIELFERKISVINSSFNLDHEKIVRWRKEILSLSQKEAHKLWDIMTEIELAASLIEKGAKLEFDVRLSNNKDLDIKANSDILKRSLFFEIKTFRPLRSKGERLRQELLEYLQNRLSGKGVVVVRLGNFSSYYFEEEIITHRQIDQLLTLIEKDVKNKQRPKKLKYHFC